MSDEHLYLDLYLREGGKPGCGYTSVGCSYTMRCIETETQ